MTRSKVTLLVVATFVVGEMNPLGWIYWKAAEWKLPRIKAESLASPSPFESISPARWLAQSEHAFVIDTADPQAPVHMLVIPKRRVTSLLEASPDLLGEMLVLARDGARTRGVADDGFRVVINTNPRGAQSVYHLHMHVLGGRQMRWPPG
jgi:histidine triad (HIT) family protein